MNATPTRPCIQAPGGRTPKGYGLRHPHRTAYETAHGPIPPGLVIDHLCHNADPGCSGGSTCLHRGCIEPTHLEAVTLGVNILRGKTIAAANARKTHCKRNHEFTPDNVYYQPGRKTKARTCRACIRVRSRERAKRRAAA